MRTRALDEALDAREVVGVDQRRDGGGVVARVAEHVLVREAVEELEERLADALLHQQARAGEAHLAGVVVLPGGLARRRLEVGVGEDEQRPLAAELTRERDDVARGGGADVHRGLGRAGERDRAARRDGGERGADLLADPLHDVEHAGGEPASWTRSQRSEQESGDHSAGFSTTVQPAASAGAVFQVESMNGAFQGVITTAGPLGMRRTRFRVPFDSQRAPRGHREVGVGAEVARAARDHPRAERPEQHRHVGALDGGEPLDVRVDQVGEPVQVRRAARGAERRPRRGPRLAAATASSASRSPPRATSARRLRVDRAQRSMNVASLPTRSPPMKCSVETSTPAIVDAAHDLMRAALAPSRGRRRCRRR